MQSSKEHSGRMLKNIKSPKVEYYTPPSLQWWQQNGHQQEVQACFLEEEGCSRRRDVPDPAVLLSAREKHADKQPHSTSNAYITQLRLGFVHECIPGHIYNTYIPDFEDSFCLEAVTKSSAIIMNRVSAERAAP